MKKSELKLMIREIVREEVALSIKEVIREITAPSQNTTQLKQERKENKTNFSSNSIINEVMNETAQDTEWKSMGGGTYDSSRMNEVMQSSYGDLMNKSSEPNPDAMVASMGINPASVSDPIKNMFTKDYRSIMKKVDEKARFKNGT